jgi:hypothetical protein
MSRRWDNGRHARACESLRALDAVVRPVRAKKIRDVIFHFVVNCRPIDARGILADQCRVVFDLCGTRIDKQATANYSWRLFVNFNAGPDFAAYSKNIRRPAAVLVGSADEQVVANQFDPLFKSLDVNIPITIVPGMTQLDMIATPTALRAVVSAVSPQM